MKFRKGQKVLQAPAMGSLESATLIAAGVEAVLAVVHMDDVVKMRKRGSQEQAWPMYIALAVGAHELHLWPTPHRLGTLKVRYYPPMEEI